MARLHYGEEGDKGFLLWDVGPEGAALSLVSTPAKRTLEIAFDGAPDMERLRQEAQRRNIAGAHIRVRWTVAEEDRQNVDRAAIAEIFADAAEVRLEGRTVPVQTARAAGISKIATLEGRVIAWAQASNANTDLMTSALAWLCQQRPSEVASKILSGTCSTACRCQIATVMGARIPSVENSLLGRLENAHRPEFGLD